MYEGAAEIERAWREGLRPSPATPAAVHVSASSALRQILLDHPLPEGVPDADMNQTEIAAALNVSVNTVGKFVARSVLAEEWENEGQFPVIEQGGMGRAYVIRLSHAWAWSQHRSASEADRDRRSRQAIEAMQATFLGIDLDDQGAVLDPKTRRAMAEADILHSKAAALRRRLVELEEMTELLESVFGIVRDGIEAMPDRLERELGLKPEQVSRVVRIGDDVLQAIIERIEEAELRERDISDVEIHDRLLV